MTTPQQPSTNTAETPWHAAFPSPTITAPKVSREEVLGWLETRKKQAHDTAVDFVLVDLRRADYEGGTIATSINLPAQSLYPSILTHYAIFRQAGIKKVVFYCGSSGGRGTRAGGWFADYIHSQNGESEMQSLVLEGGIKGWVNGGKQYVEQMEGYEASVWQRVLNQ